MSYVLGQVIGALALLIVFTVKDPILFMLLLAIVTFGGAALNAYIS